jgi:hypothetical protein
MSRGVFMAKAAAAARDLADALARLAQEGEINSIRPDLYDSENLPPRTSRRRFAELCRSGRIAGAYREGRDWVCSRESWHSSRMVGARAAPTMPERDSLLVERADALLRRRGLRVLSTSGGRGNGERTR